jgi:ABC-type Zn2+ transport system substrate-binding protein/surface adhesin
MPLGRLAKALSIGEKIMRALEVSEAVREPIHAQHEEEHEKERRKEHEKEHDTKEHHRKGGKVKGGVAKKALRLAKSRNRVAA